MRKVITASLVLAVAVASVASAHLNLDAELSTGQLAQEQVKRPTASLLLAQEQVKRPTTSLLLAQEQVKRPTDLAASLV